MREVRRLERGLGGGRRLGGARGGDGWPRRGVYLVLDPREVAADGGRRVVRVGTHALHAGSASTLWGRLRTHRGTAAGGGHHRASVFRRHVGAALLAAHPGLPRVPTWGRGAAAGREVPDAEAAHERPVSEYLGELVVLWLDVDDAPGAQGLRGRVERGAVALLAAHARRHGAAGPDWLGRHADRAAIRASGLWNVNHVGDPLDAALPDLLEGLVDRTLGGAPAPGGRPPC
jgi:hypothetical protein